MKPCTGIASLILFGVATATGTYAAAAHSGDIDSRIRVIQYQPQGVTKVLVQRGTVTRIILEEDERIDVSVIGLSADCNSPTDEWCIAANTGSNQIFVRPRDSAKKNNMEMRTNKRDYSIEFDVVTGHFRGRENHASQSTAFYRVIFDYAKPKPKLPTVPMSPERVAATGALTRALGGTLELAKQPKIHPQSPDDRLNDEPVGAIRNTNYSKQVLPNGDDAEPSAVFDDGRFTYFEFLGAREIPAIFAHGSDDEPYRVNWHMQPPFVVVERTARKFTLRLGGAIVGIFNEAFDPVGIETPNSTVSDEVQRTIKKDVTQ